MDVRLIAFLLISILILGSITMDVNSNKISIKPSQKNGPLLSNILPEPLNSKGKIINEIIPNIQPFFLENKGQIKNEAIRFYSQGSCIWFTDDGVWFEVREEIIDEHQKSGMGIRESKCLRSRNQ